jgi:hypothetical protein
MTSGFGHDEDRFGEVIEREAAKHRQAQQPHPKARGVRQSTWDACLWFIRQYGVERVNDLWLTVRLAEFSDDRIEELLAALTRLSAKPQWQNTVTQELIEELTKLRV